MTLITVAHRAPRPVRPPSEKGYTASLSALVALATLAVLSAGAARMVWLRVGSGLDPIRALGSLMMPGLPPILAIVSLAAPVILFVGLRLAPVTARGLWLFAWATGAPWLLLSLSWLLPLPLLALAWALPLGWMYLGLWPLAAVQASALHRARWAERRDLRSLLSAPSRPTNDRPAGLPPPEALVLGRLGRDWASVRVQPRHRELGGVLVVGRPRSGKGLLATTQLLGAWEQRSVVITDLKGEAHAATAGYRTQLGKVLVLDPTGVGHRFDPLADRHTEDDLYRMAQDLLHVDGEGDGQAFTERAAAMLCAVFLAAKREAVPCLPYTRELIRLGLRGAGARLDRIDPLLCRLLLADAFEDADWESRFLTGSWQTLVSRVMPLLTENVVRTFGGSDFRPADLLGPEPISVYLRLTERDMRGLKPLLRLVWESLLNDMVAHNDQHGGDGCRPVLLMLDEAARFAVPSLPAYAATVPGRGISLWVAVQSLSQLDGVYGRADALALRDSLESQVFYRPSELATAQWLEERLGEVSAYARSYSASSLGRHSESRAERPVPLLSAYEILQLPAEHVLVFHRDLPPAGLWRANWLEHPVLVGRQSLPTPLVQALPAAPGLPTLDSTVAGAGADKDPHVPPSEARHSVSGQPHRNGYQLLLDAEAVRTAWQLDRP
jgi:type IV secretion system protein VirD4